MSLLFSKRPCRNIPSVSYTKRAIEIFKYSAKLVSLRFALIL